MYLNIENLVKYYNEENSLIKDLNFNINKGEFVSFVGESGSGKTIFLKCLAGLEKINSGKITLNTRVLNDENTFIKPNLRKIGFIFQDYHLFPILIELKNPSPNLNSRSTPLFPPLALKKKLTTHAFHQVYPVSNSIGHPTLNSNKQLWFNRVTEQP